MGVRGRPAPWGPAGATYAGESDPYRKPEPDEDESDQDESEQDESDAKDPGADARA